ncbi:MAG: cold-shock protein [Patescibacteria group bacterium]|nr:cold-shock protein [Patescibacteria group bacterium]
MTASPVLHSHHVIDKAGKIERATVKLIDPKKGFFILERGDGQPDIFLHREITRRCHMRDPSKGDSVLVRFGQGPKGLVATEVWTA